MRSARTVGIQIRPLAEEEIDRLETSLPAPPPANHRERFGLQEQGEAAYLVAWQDDQPLGHVLILWSGSPHEPMASDLSGCPVVEDLLVRPDLRSQGIGSQLMDVAEALVRERGYARVGLAVGRDNPRARALYERRGYRLSTFGEFSHETLDVGRDGWWHRSRETDIFLIKEL